MVKGREKGEETDSLSPKTWGQEAKRPVCCGGRLGLLESKFKVMNVSLTQRAPKSFHFSEGAHSLRDKALFLYSFLREALGKL